MIDLDIRPLEPEDARAVAELVAHPDVARSLGGTPLDPPLAYERRYRASFEHGGADRLGALHGGALAGMVEITRSPRPRLAHAGQLTLAVHPSERGRGVGGALLEAALEAADRWMNVVRLTVEILADDEDARRFFEARGFDVEVRRRGALLVDGALADTLALGRVRPGFVQPEGALRPMPDAPRSAEGRRPAPRSIVIRPIAPEDAEVSARFSQDVTILRASGQTPTLGADHWRRRIEGWADGTWAALAVADGEIAACGNIHTLPSPRRRHAVVLGISVLAPFQGLGVGDRLMTALIDTAESWLGAERVELAVLADNARAVRLYEKHGFAHEGRVRFDAWRDGGYADALVMARLRTGRRPG